MFKRIDHVEIVTGQLDRTVQFYTEVLGFIVKVRDRIDRSGLGVPRPGLSGSRRHRRRADFVRWHSGRSGSTD